MKYTQPASALHKIFNNFSFVLVILITGLLAGCFNRIGDINNACELLEDNRSWYKGVKKASLRWNVPKHTILAFIHQESKFRAKAKPPRKRLFGFIPTFRPSSAYGFPQALDSTWRTYQKQTGSRFAQRDDFDDAADFIGWYIDGSRTMLKLPAHNVTAHYLAYHEGRGGYANGSYKNKGWLNAVAEKVQSRSMSYASQLKQCEAGLNRNRFLFF